MGLGYLFQFQYGAAESVISTFDKGFFEISIPVWCSWKVIVSVFCFAFNRFQFQYGAAESIAVDHAKAEISYFNSSMVQLKGAWMTKYIRSYKISIPVWCSWKFIPVHHYELCSNFNSSMVQLKDIPLIWSLLLTSLHFNSSMVQLKVIAIISTIPFYKFQFQYGAAESCEVVNPNCTDVISIPVWCSWKIFCATAIDFPLPFQFQYGAAESWIELMTTMRGFFVSIPVWCSWKVFKHAKGVVF